jgi:hypothetical protein
VAFALLVPRLEFHHKTLSLVFIVSRRSNKNVRNWGGVHMCIVCVCTCDTLAHCTPDGSEPSILLQTSTSKLSS